MLAMTKGGPTVGALWGNHFSTQGRFSQTKRWKPREKLTNQIFGGGKRKPSIPKKTSTGGGTD